MLCPTRCQHVDTFHCLYIARALAQSSGTSTTPEKSAADEREQGVAIGDAQTAFADENAKLIDDPDHSEEDDRFVPLGLSSRLRLHVVCHCYRTAGNVIRIAPPAKLRVTSGTPTHESDPRASNMTSPLHARIRTPHR
jgi:uncharacterized DUF497 family protein